MPIGVNPAGGARSMGLASAMRRRMVKSCSQTPGALLKLPISLPRGSRSFVVSHPFARTKAKGLGTEMVQKQAVKDLVSSAKKVRHHSHIVVGRMVKIVQSKACL